MRFSTAFIPTLREDPADAQVISHKLMTRAGMIKKTAAGIYTMLPLGLRVINKISAIIREEMHRAGSNECQMPMVLPAELWIESGRWKQYGPELLRLKDRKDAEFCLGPTHEEVFTVVVRDHVKSYRQLPISLYQIQTKFRDEIRPRFGLMRGREFLMKDAYSFDVDQEGALKAYDRMYEAYQRIFKRCGLSFRAVEADTGNIGGNRSHEFQVLAETGEDLIASCDNCGYAANVELAFIAAPKEQGPAAEFSTAPHGIPPKEDVRTPGKTSITDVADFLGLPTTRLIKAMMLWVDETPVMALCRGDHEINEIKVKKMLGGQGVQLMDDASIAKYAGPVGYIGPVAVGEGVRVVCDLALKGAVDFVCGSGKIDTHTAHVSVGRDFDAEFFDLRKAQAGDPCGRCGHTLRVDRGIEVGHVFYLGTKYSKAMNAKVLDETGGERVIEMGSYGIGVGRTAAAAIEQNHDENGIIWPAPISPFHVSLVRLGDAPAVVEAADRLYNELVVHGVEVLYDDRDERPGVKFKDHDLLGFPLRVVVGGKGLEEGVVELKARRAKESTRVPIAEAAGVVATQLREMIQF
jgi:prolyl-tRNA synthetase